MTVSLKVEVNQSDLDELKASLGADGREVRVAASRAINDTVRHARARVSRALREFLPLKKKLTDKHLERSFASPKNLAGALVVRDRGPLPLWLFRARQTKAGVTVLLDKTAARETIAGAFGPEIDKLRKQVFAREGAARLPLKKLFGPNLHETFERHNMATTAAAGAQEYLEQRMVEQLKLVMR